jgi:thiamine transport system ATP-binding protein
MPDELEIDDLTVELGGVPVLDGVSLVAPAGKTTAVLGPSGGGKTTLLRAVTGLEAVTGGRIVVGGRDVTDLPAHRRGVGLAFQDRALFPHRNVAANVGFGLRMAGWSAADITRRVDEVLELVGLSGFGSRRVDRLSGGEAQRVALARALAPEPGVLCLDEPLGALDRVLHDRLMAELRTLFDGLSTTVVHVTHDQREALALADHLVVMGGGSVLQSGDPVEVWQRPATVEVAAFLGQDVLVDPSMVTGGSAAWEAAAVGAEAVVVRPEAVVLGSASGAGGASGFGNDGIITEVTFEGDRTVMVVEVPGMPPLRAVAQAVPPQVGDRVGVTIDVAGTWPVRSTGRQSASSPTGHDTPVPPRPQ